MKRRRVSTLLEDLFRYVEKHGLSPLKTSAGKKTYFGGGPSVQNVIAFSGGVDSTLAAYVVHQVYPHNTLAAIAVSPSLASVQRENAHNVIKDINNLNQRLWEENKNGTLINESLPSLPIVECVTQEGLKEGYIRNEGDACLHCKRELYSVLATIHKQMSSSSTVGVQDGANQPSTSEENEVKIKLFNGTNADDLGDPTRVQGGLRAAQEFSVVSPLAALQITKDEVREIAKHIGLSNWNLAAAPCLRSRLALGVQATKDHMNAVEIMEDAVREAKKFSPETNLRVRLLAKKRIAIEVDEELVPPVESMIAKHLERSVTAENQSVALESPYKASASKDISVPQWSVSFQSAMDEIGFQTVLVRPFKSGSVSVRSD
eukprot:g1868.t1